MADYLFCKSIENIIQIQEVEKQIECPEQCASVRCSQAEGAKRSAFPDGFRQTCKG